MEKYYRQIWTGNTYYYLILDENCETVKKVRDDKDVEGLTEVYRSTDVIADLYENNTDVGNGFVILGNRIPGAARVAAASFKD